MALIPSIIYRQALLRIGAYRGQPADIEASYVESDPTSDSISESFVPTSFKDQVVAVEQEIAIAVSMADNHPWANLIGDITAPIASGDLIPTAGTSSANSQIIGKYRSVRDTEGPFRVLTKDLPISEIRSLDLSFSEFGAMYKSDFWAFEIEDGRLHHTRSLATVDVCVYDYVSRKTAIFNDAALIFQNAENAYFSGVMSMLKNTDATLAELAALYDPRYEAWLSTFRAGKTEL